MAEVIKPERPGGFLDFLPADYLAREKMLATISGVFRSFGFDPIETPRIEFLKTLAGEESDTGKNIFRVQGGTDEESLAMPFDHTVPFARILAGNPYDAKKRTGIRLPWRRMVVGPVFRTEKPQAGRYRQFYQFDLDIAGVSSMLADAEIVTMIHHTMAALGIERFLIRINNRKILNGLSEVVGLSERKDADQAALAQEMMRILDKQDKLGLDEVMRQLAAPPETQWDIKPNLDRAGLEKVKSFLCIGGDNQAKLQGAREVFAGSQTAMDGIAELKELLSYLAPMGCPESKVAVDFSVARGLDYYTGPVMETQLLDAPQFGSVFSGGRYNGLVARFTGQELPATGASIGVDRLFAALAHLELLDRKRISSCEVFIMRLLEDANARYLQIASELRAAGLNAEVSLLDDLTFKAQFNYGLGRGANYIVICGGDEIAKNEVQVRNLATREQVAVPMEGLKAYFTDLAQ